MKKENNYFFEIILLPIIIIIFLVFGITFYNIQITKKQLDRHLETKKLELINSHKNLVYEKVQFLNKTINIENSKIENELKSNLYDKIKTAIKISKDAIDENKGLSENILRKVIAKRLSYFKYNNERGYFFIVDKNGVFLEHPIKSLVGKNMRGFIDKNNVQIEQLLRSVAKKDEIGFAKYSFFMPDDKESKQYSKITAVTHFKPLDILIGTGEYYDSVTEERKKELLIKISNTIEDKSKYLFVLDLHNINGGKNFATRLVSNNKNKFIYKKLDSDVVDEKGFKYREEYLKLLREKGEGFVTNWYKKPDSDESAEKTTYYVFNSEWNWIIGSGFYTDEIDKSINSLKQENSSYLKELISNSIFFGTLFTIIMIVFSTIIFYKIQKRINSDKIKILRNEESLKKAQKVAKIGSWDYDLKNDILNCSDEIYNLFEIKVDDEISYKKFLHFVHKDDRFEVEKVFTKTIETKSSHNFSHKIVVNGKIKYVINQAEVYFDKKKNRTFIFGTIQDITEKHEKDKKLEEQTKLIFNQAKMAAMGEMLENIAHQWRQPLSAISTSASGIKIEKEFGILDNEKLDKSLDDIVNYSNYLSTTIDDFRDFFVKDRKKKICDLKKSYEHCLSLIKSKFANKNISIISEVDSVECEILENELIQCFMNIFNNSFDVLKDLDIKDKFIYSKIYKKNHHAIIILGDNGGGIDEKIIDKIFEPYFTTKHKSQGTGIGLYMTQEIIVKHLNGFIKVSNDKFEYEGKEYIGAAFKITIPLNNS